MKGFEGPRYRLKSLPVNSNLNIPSAILMFISGGLIIVEESLPTQCRLHPRSVRNTFLSRIPWQPYIRVHVPVLPLYVQNERFGLMSQRPGVGLM